MMKTFVNRALRCHSRTLDTSPMMLTLFFAVSLVASGCSGEPGAVERAATEKLVSAKDVVPDEPPPQTEPALDEPEEKTGSTGPKELKLEQSGITFVVPEGWERVKPQNNVVEAELMLPRTPDDEYDGSLKLMSSGGPIEDAIARRTAEFNFEPGEGPTQEKIEISGREATLLDLRGAWSGPSHSPIKMRPGYRMVLVILPFGPQSAFYANLTGPRATIAAHEDAFREFLKSAKVSR